MSKKPRKPKTAPSSVCRVNKNANYKRGGRTGADQAQETA